MCNEFSLVKTKDLRTGVELPSAFDTTTVETPPCRSSRDPTLVSSPPSSSEKRMTLQNYLHVISTLHRSILTKKLSRFKRSHRLLKIFIRTEVFGGNVLFGKFEFSMLHRHYQVHSFNVDYLDTKLRFRKC